MEIIQKIASLANSLDNKKLYHLADDLDHLNQMVVKVAQYVGSQGYWIRNERCWTNCYRQKRTNSPSTTAQVIWQECQKEFQASLTDDTSSWDKYAKVDAKIIKTASLVNISNAFLQEVEIKTAGGNDRGLVAYELMNREIEGPRQDLIQGADRIFRIAERLQPINIDLSDQAFAIGEELLKMAQFNNSWLSKLWNSRINPAMWRRKNYDSGTQRMVMQRIQRALQEAKKLRYQFPQDNTPASRQDQRRLTEAVDAFAHRVNSEIRPLRDLAMRSHDPTAMQEYQKVMQSYNALGSLRGRVDDLPSRRAVLDRFIQTLEAVPQNLGQANNAEQSQSNAGSEVGAPQGVNPNQATNPGSQVAGPQTTQTPQATPQSTQPTPPPTTPAAPAQPVPQTAPTAKQPIAPAVAPQPQQAQPQQTPGYGYKPFYQGNLGTGIKPNEQPQEIPLTNAPQQNKPRVNPVGEIPLAPQENSKFSPVGEIPLAPLDESLSKAVRPQTARPTPTTPANTEMPQPKAPDPTVPAGTLPEDEANEAQESETPFTDVVAPQVGEPVAGGTPGGGTGLETSTLNSGDGFNAQNANGIGQNTVTNPPAGGIDVEPSPENSEVSTNVGNSVAPLDESQEVSDPLGLSGEMKPEQSQQKAIDKLLGNSPEESLSDAVDPTSKKPGEQMSLFDGELPSNEELPETEIGNKKSPVGDRQKRLFNPLTNRPTRDALQPKRPQDVGAVASTKQKSKDLVTGNRKELLPNSNGQKLSFFKLV